MAKEFFKNKTILEPIEFWGNWCIPQKGVFKEELTGNVDFQTNTHGNLVLNGNFQDTPLQYWKDYPVLWGTNSHLKISIFDIFVRSMPLIASQKNAPVTVGFSEYWEGDVYFEKREDVKFRSISFGINNLEMWHNPHNYGGTYSKRTKKIHLTLKRVPNVELFEDENVKIFLGYNVSGPNLCYGQTISSIRQSARIVIKSKRGKKLPFYGNTPSSYQYYIEMIFSFLSLMIGKNTFIYDIVGTVKSTKKYKGNISWGIHATRYWRQSITEKHLKELSITEISLPYIHVKDCLKDIILQYSNYHHKISCFVWDLVEYQNRHQAINHHLLPLLMFLFEGIVRELYPTELKKCTEDKIFTEEYENIKKIIFDKCNRNEQKWLNKQLTPRPKLRDCYDVALAAAEDLFDYLKIKTPTHDAPEKTLIDDMFSYLRKERNRTAHALNIVAFDRPIYVYAIMWLHLLYTIIIWKKCGVSVSVMKETFKHHTSYNKLKSIIPVMLLEMPKAK